MTTLQHEPYHEFFQRRKNSREARAAREAAVATFLTPANPPPPAPPSAGRPPKILEGSLLNFGRIQPEEAVR